MNEILAITAFRDDGDRYRRRNMAACIDRVAAVFPEADHLVAEQGDGAWLRESGLSGRVRHSCDGTPVTEPFHKASLLDSAVRDNPGYRLYVMVDADLYMTRPMAEYIIANAGPGKLLFPYGDTAYLDETDTRRLVSAGKPWGGPKDRGATLNRQTGLCNAFTRDTFDAVGGFDREFLGWGAEDDSFLFKCRRVGTAVERNPDKDVVAYHMFHPKVNTREYIEGSAYRKNRVMCACVRRMSEEDFASYVSGNSTLSEMVEKYSAMGRLGTELILPVIEGTPPLYLDRKSLKIDTTIYDVRAGASFSDVLDEIEKEDGPAGLLEFIDGVMPGFSPLPEDIESELARRKEKACSDS